MMKYCLKKFQISNTCNDVFKLMKKTVKYTKRDDSEAFFQFNEYRTKQCIDHLLLLYTLETDLYRALQSNVDSFAIEVYLHLSSLKQRAFKGGPTYRGMTMEKNVLQNYQWAAKNKGRLIEIKTMTSTSAVKSVAIDRAREALEYDAEHGFHKDVFLMKFSFPDTCYTAIDLSIAKPLSQYPQEKEVLLLPGTLFEVHGVTRDEDTGYHLIQLENVPISQKFYPEHLMN
ncbi:hypothetical protein I4U23_004048 [Adineta vaga]|nr:hypothetical protein I4U23_004048 [Adineta vaga]